MIDPEAASHTDILARTLWAEARGEGDEGMHAVANVVMNRAARPGWWGTDIKSVCLYPWQFSCWNASDPNRGKLLAVTDADPQFTNACQIAAQATATDLPDITLGATSYYNPDAVVHTPSWAIGKTPKIQIGHHLFF